MNETTKMLSDIRERVVRVETKIDTMTDIQIEVDKVKKTANEAFSSTKSAHKRIDKIDKYFFWITTTVIGAVIIGVITFWKGGGM